MWRDPVERAQMGVHWSEQAANMTHDYCLEDSYLKNRYHKRQKVREQRPCASSLSKILRGKPTRFCVAPSRPALRVGSGGPRHPKRRREIHQSLQRYRFALVEIIQNVSTK